MNERPKSSGSPTTAVCGAAHSSHNHGNSGPRRLVGGLRCGLANRFDPVIIRRLSRTLSDHLVTAAGNAIARLFGLAAGVIVARSLSVIEFGTYTAGFTLSTILAQTSAIVDGPTLIYARGEARGIVLRASLLVRSLLLVGGSVALAPICALLSGFMSPARATWDVLFVGCVTGLAYPMVSTALTVSQLDQRFARYAIIRLGSGAVIAAATLLPIVLMRPSPLNVLSAACAATVGTGVVASGWILQRAPSSCGGAPVLRAARMLLSSGGWLAVANLAYLIYQRLDVLLLAHYAGSREVGLYGAAVRYFGILALFTSSLSVVMSAKGTSQTTWNNPDERRRYLLESAFVVGGAFLVTTVACSGAGILLPGLFGPEYRDAVPSAVILALGGLPLAIYTPFMYALYAFEHTRTVAIVSAAQLLAALLTASTLIPAIGTMGAALSSVAAYTTGVVGFYLAFRFHAIPGLSRSVGR